MGTDARPRTKPPEQRRCELLNAAERLFIEHGVAPTTIEQITSGANVAKGTFYLHFSSKDDVLEGLRERFVLGLRDRIKAELAGTPAEDWRGKLATWAGAFAIGYLDSIRLHDVVFIETHAPARQGTTDNAVIDHLRELIEAGTRAEAWSIEAPGFLAVFLFNALHGVVHDAIHRQQPLDRTSLVSRLQRQCCLAVELPV